MSVWIEVLAAAGGAARAGASACTHACAPGRAGAAARARVARAVRGHARLVALLMLAPLLVEAALPQRVVAQLRQGVTGIVRDQSTGFGIQGAFVALIDADGRRVGGVLTLADGRYLLQVATPGTYRLQAERIGFESAPSEQVRIEPGGVVRLDLTASTQAVELEGIEVDGARRCDLGREGEATMALWDEATKALAVARWTEVSERFTYELRSWERTLGPRGRRLLDERERRSTHVGRHAYRALEPETLEREGYVSGDLADGFRYYAPDAETLLSDEFLRTHCFRSVRDGDRLGLEFAPVEGREVPDVEGTLWMAPGTTRLDRLEYQYVNLPDVDEAGVQAMSGGEVRFEELAGGEWIVRWWEIRMPVLVRRMNLGRPPRPVLQVAEVRTQGGEVEEVRLATSSVRLGEPSRSGLGRIVGTVADSTQGTPLAGAVVYLSGTSRRAESDSVGRFALSDLRPGVYTVALQHPRLAQLGIRPPTALIEVAEGTVARADLAIPSLRSLVAEACSAVGAAAEQPGLAAVGGVVRTGGVSVDELQVRVRWQYIEQRGGRPAAVGEVAELMPDALGRWGVCIVPTGHRVSVQVVRGADASDEVDLGTLERDETRWVTLPAPPERRR